MELAMMGTLKKISLINKASGVRMFVFADLDEMNQLIVGSLCKVLQFWGPVQYTGFVVVDDAEEKYTEVRWDSKTWTGGETKIDLVGSRQMRPGAIVRTIDEADVITDWTVLDIPESVS
jgi:hypothetical protein